MRVVLAGGHGQIALRLERLLADRGDVAVGLVRDPLQVQDLRAAGAEAVVCDLERTTAAQLAGHLQGADAVVFAAGAGPGSAPGRKESVDRDGAVLLAEAAVLAGVRRYLLVSSMGAGAAPPPGTDEVFAGYLAAKTAAEEALRTHDDLDWTVLRPGALTDDPGTGLVELAPSVARGSVPRDDVAAVLAALLDAPWSHGAVLELVAGATPVQAASGPASLEAPKTR